MKEERRGRKEEGGKRREERGGRKEEGGKRREERGGEKDGGRKGEGGRERRERGKRRENEKRGGMREHQFQPYLYIGPTFSVWTTLLLLLTYGKDSCVVRTVLRMHCSVISPCALPVAVYGVLNTKRPANITNAHQQFNLSYKND